MNFPLCRYAPVTTSAPTNVTVLCRRNAVPGQPPCSPAAPMSDVNHDSATSLKIYAQIEVYAYDKILQAISDISSVMFERDF